MKLHHFLISSSLITTTAYAQTDRNNPTFASPLNIPIDLSGNFMELRNDHFHSGLDMRTGGQEGQPVKAVADGWVSRIKISPWGYGKAVYIDHPSGHTTVYGHLRNLLGDVAQYTLDAQYREKCFDVDLYVEKGKLPVKLGEVFAHSGNSGGSGGPHLHFEVRRSSDQFALDPEAYGMEVPDRVPPTLRGLRIDGLDSTARVQPYPGQAVGHALVAKNDSTYLLKEGTVVQAFGPVGLAVNVYDQYSNSDRKFGIRRIEVTVDGQAVYSALLDHVDFSKNRYANAYMDYRLFKANSMDYNRCYRLPGNALAVYGKEPAQGRIVPEVGKDHAVVVTTTDANGNRSRLSFTLRGVTAEAAKNWAPTVPSGTLFRYDRENKLEKEGLKFTLAAKSLYQDERIDHTKAAAIAARDLTALHQVGDPLIPLHTQGTISLLVEKPVTAEKTSKLVVVRTDHQGKRAAIGGTYAQGWITTKTKGLGGFTVQIDTIPPKVTNVDLKANMAGRRSFTLKVEDDLSGVDVYTGRLNGEWILMDYDPKTKSLTHLFDKHTDKPGKQVFTLDLVDERKNRTTFRQEFTR